MLTIDRLLIKFLYFCKDLNSRLMSVAAVVLAFAILIGATPRLGNTFSRLIGDPAATLLRTGQPLTKEAVSRLRRSRETALGWLRDASSLADLGLLSLYLAEKVAPEAERERHLTEARGYFEQALARSPANSVGWMWLSFVHSEIGDLFRAADALRLSLMASHHHPAITGVRAQLALSLWTTLDRDTRHGALEDIRLTLRRDPEKIALAAHEFGMLDLVREALAEDTVSLELFDVAFIKFGT